MLDINIIFGLITVTLSTLLYYTAFRFYLKNNYKATIVCILLAGLILRMYTSCDFFLHEWDERYHALVAKNLLENPFKPMLYSQPLLDYDYKSWSDNHIWLHKQPVPLYTMALSLLLFGVNEIALRIPSIILCTASIWATYKIGSILYSERTGLLAAFLFSIHGLIIEQTAGRVATDHIDVFFLSFISFSVYFLLSFTKTRNHINLIAGIIFTALAILSKWLPALIVLPIWVISAYGHFRFSEILKYSLIFIFFVALLVLPWQMYILYEFPLEASWEYTYNRKHVLEVLGPHGHAFYYHFNKMRIIFGELIYIPLIWLIYISIKNLKQNHFIIIIWILMPYLFFSFAKTKMQGYILFTAPAVFIMTALCYEYLQTVTLKRVFVVRLISFLLFLLPIRYSIERIKPFTEVARTQSWISQVKNLETENAGKRVVFVNFKYAIEAMFYTEMIVYEKLPDSEQLQKIIDSGYKVYIDNWQKIPEEIKNMKQATFTQISGELN